MLDDLLGRGFSSKVKSLIKVTKTRIDSIRKKRNATHKFLNKDIAHLLANGLDINAFGRAEGLVTELILSSCYDFLEHCCECVLKNLSLLQKKRKCSEDCKVAVASLMFAAARFSDLPELRSLRQIFQGRYGNSLDHYVNQKFAKNLSTKPASMESKLQLLQDIAFQYSIDWNAKAFEQRMSIASLSTQKAHLNYESFRGTDNGSNSCKTESVSCTSLRGLFDTPNQDSKENANSRNEARNVKSFDDTRFSNVNSSFNDNEDVSVRGDKNVTEILDHNSSKFSSSRGIEVSHMVDSHTAKTTIPSRNKNIKAQDHREYVTSDQIQSGCFSKEINCGFAIGGHKSLEVAKNTTPRRLSHREPETSSTNEHHQLSSETESRYVGSLVSSNENQKNKGQAQVGGESKIKYFHPPPYVKLPKIMQERVDSESKDAKLHEDFVADGVNAVEHTTVSSGSGHDSVQAKFDDPKHVKSTSVHMKPPKGRKHVAFLESEHTGSSQKRIDGHLDAIAHRRSKSDQIGEHGRTTNHYRNEASSINHDDIAKFILPKPRSTRRRSTRSSSHDSIRIDGSDKYDEKRIISRASNRRRRRESRRVKHRALTETDIPLKDEEMILDNLLIHYSSKPSNLDAVDNAVKKNGDVLQVTTPFPPRSVSLPREQSVPLQPTKVFTRAATFQLDRAAQHVHPKLPDYDDLAARFSGMKVKF